VVASRGRSVGRLKPTGRPATPVVKRSRPAAVSKPTATGGRAVPGRSGTAMFEPAAAGRQRSPSKRSVSRARGRSVSVKARSRSTRGSTTGVRTARGPAPAKKTKKTRVTKTDAGTNTKASAEASAEDGGLKNFVRDLILGKV